MNPTDYAFLIVAVLLLSTVLAGSLSTRFGLPALLPKYVKTTIKKADRLCAFFEAVQLAGFSVEEAREFFGKPPLGFRVDVPVRSTCVPPRVPSRGHPGTTTAVLLRNVSRKRRPGVPGCENRRRALRGRARAGAGGRGRVRSKS